MLCARFAFALLALASASVAGAPAERARVRLDYRLGPGVDDCATEAELQRAVTARLGYEPWDSSAPRVIHVDIARAPAQLGAIIEMRDGAGRSLGKRELRAPAGQCAALIDSVSLAIGIALDPLLPMRPAPPAPPAPAQLPAPTPTPPPHVASAPLAIVEPPAPTPIRFGIAAGAVGGLGLLPSISLGGALQLSLTRGSLQVALEGRGDLPAHESIAGGELSGSLLSATALVCGLPGEARFALCLLGGVASFRLSGDVNTSARDATSALGYAGLRAEARLPFSKSLAGRISLDAAGTFGVVTLQDSRTGKSLWSSYPVALALGAGVAWTLQ